MPPKIDPNRHFQLWEYHVSHGTALIRSPGTASEDNIDIMLLGVEYLALPRHMEAVALEPGTQDDLHHAEQRLGREVDPDRVWALASGGVRHLVVAARVEVRQTSMDVFESPFEER